MLLKLQGKSDWNFLNKKNIQKKIKTLIFWTNKQKILIKNQC